MANTFALILAIATLLTGIIWGIDKVKWAPARRARHKELKVQMGSEVDDTALQQAIKQPGWVETAVSIFPVLLIVFVVRSFILEPYQIPSGSMMPTLLIGDFILVEKYAYGIKDPITQTTLISTGHPKRGDIVVFRYPGNPSLDYIKRAVGLPGDHVIYDPVAKTVTIYPACNSSSPCDKSLPITYSDIKRSNFIQTFGTLDGSDPGSGFWHVPQGEMMPRGLRLDVRQETLDGVTHDILLIPQVQSMVDKYYQQPGVPVSSWIVPQGMYFMLGDNRDNSEDSRYWGFVPEKNLVGKAVAIWMSFEKQQGEWPTGVRLNRIGRIH